MSDKISKIIFINLDKRPDRRTEIEQELASMELSAERFSAILHPTIGIAGCSRSHLEVLKIAKERGYANVLILEDDFQFTTTKEVLEEKLRELFDSGIAFDVCMLSYLLNRGDDIPEHGFIKRVLEAQTASGYIVNQHYYDELIQLLEWSTPILEETNQHWIYGNDQIWKRLQVTGSWVCFSEPLGKQRAGFSDCAGKFMDYGV